MWTGSCYWSRCRSPDCIGWRSRRSRAESLQGRFQPHKRQRWCSTPRHRKSFHREQDRLCKSRSLRHMCPCGKNHLGPNIGAEVRPNMRPPDMRLPWCNTLHHHTRRRWLWASPYTDPRFHHIRRRCIDRPLPCNRVGRRLHKPPECRFLRSCKTHYRRTWCHRRPGT